MNLSSWSAMQAATFAERVFFCKSLLHIIKNHFFVIDPIYHTAEGSESNPRSSLAILLRYVERKFAREDQEITVFPVGRVDNLLEFFEDGDDLRPHVIFDIDSDAFNDDSDLYRIFPSILRQNGVMLQLKHGFFDNPGAHAHTAGRVLTKGGDAEFMEGVRHPEATRSLLRRSYSSKPIADESLILRGFSVQLQKAANARNVQFGKAY